MEVDTESFFLKISFFIFRPTSAWLWIKSYKKRPKKFNRRLHYDFKMAAILDFYNVRRLSVGGKISSKCSFCRVLWVKFNNVIWFLSQEVMHMVYNRELSQRLLFAAVAILSLAGNLFFIVLIVRYRKLMKNAYHVVLLNLAFTDMMTGDVIFFSVGLWILIFYVRSNIRLVIDK